MAFRTCPPGIGPGRRPGHVDRDSLLPVVTGSRNNEERSAPHHSVIRGIAAVGHRWGKSAVATANRRRSPSAMVKPVAASGTVTRTTVVVDVEVGKRLSARSRTGTPRG